MPRRASLPGADLLFGGSAETPPAKDPEAAPRRVRAEAASEKDAPAPRPAAVAPVQKESEAPVSPPAEQPAARRREPTKPASGKPAGDGGGAPPRHQEKITIYCTDSDLTRLEAARLDLRANYRLASDRGRIVRAALAEILDDFDARGADSALVKRLSAQ